MFSRLKNISFYNGEQNNPQEYVVVLGNTLLNRYKEIVNYKMYSIDEVNTLKSTINAIEKANKMKLEFGIVDNKKQVINDGRFWYDGIGQIYRNLKLLYNPIPLLTDEDYEQIYNVGLLSNYEVSVMQDELKTSGNKFLESFDDIGLKYNTFDKQDFQFFDSLNLMQKWVYLNCLEGRRLVYLDSFYRSIDEIFNDTERINNYKYVVPYNKKFFRTMLYYFNTKAMELYEKALSNPKQYSDISDDVDEAKFVLTYLEMSDEDCETISISKEMYNVFFRRKYA